MTRTGATARSIAAGCALAVVAWLPACKTEVDPETYVGNWHGESGDLLITPSKAMFIRERGERVVTSTSGQIKRWEGEDPVVEPMAFLLSAERTIDIEKAPFRDGDTWKLRWNGSELTRLPDHAPFGAPFAESFDVEPPGWGTGVITADCVVPLEHRSLIGQWRGLSLDIVIAQDGQVRAEKRGWFGTPKVDGVVSEWTDAGFVVKQRDGDDERFAVQRRPEQRDGRWEMTIDGVAVVKVFDGTPIGAHGNWREEASVGLEATLARQCLAGFMNACVMLSRKFDRWNDYAPPEMEGPAKIGTDVYCCQRCDPSRYPIRCVGCTSLPADGKCEAEMMLTNEQTECRWDPATGEVECRVRRDKVTTTPWLAPR